MLIRSLLLTLAVLAGCTSTEDLMTQTQPLSTRDADRQYKARLLQLVDGQTTRSDVIALMGDPDRVSDDESTLMYYWDTRRRDGEELIRNFVIAEFDRDDVLKRHKLVAHESRFGGPKLPDTAMAEFQTGVVR